MSRKQAVQLASVIGYLALMGSWLYGVVDQGLDVPQGLTWVVLIAAQLGAGILVGWPALLLPPIIALASIPLGYSDAPEFGEELPIWFSAIVLSIPAVLLIGLGVVGRWIYRRRSWRVGLLVAVLIVGAVAIAAALGWLNTSSTVHPKGNFSVSAAKSYRGFPVFYPGESTNGYELTAVSRDPLGPMRRDQESILFSYGTCEDESSGFMSEGGCALPVSVSNEPACSRNFGMYGGGLGPSPSLMKVRGTAASFFEGGSRLEIQTGATTVVIFAQTARQTRAVARHLRGVNLGVSETGPLPPPAPGALRGKVPCPQ